MYYLNKKYWENFYKNQHIKTPTSFARFVLNYLNCNFPQYNSIIELGCGNGRDTCFFGKQGYKILGVDEATLSKNMKNVKFIKLNINKLFFKKNKYDIVYSRFFIHAIDDNLINNILKWTKKLFIAEFRAEEDVPILYPKHYRNKINGNKFINKLIENKFDIVYYNKSKNLASYKNENPIIIRIIGVKQ